MYYLLNEMSKRREIMYIYFLTGLNSIHAKYHLINYFIKTK